MDGVHDMGGMHGFGAVPYEKDQATFHHDWECKAWGLCQGATQPDWANLDYFRHSLERMPPELYLSYSYFERWLYGLQTTLLEGDLVTLAEIMSGKAASGEAARGGAAGPEAVNPYVRPSYHREIEAGPRFAVGDRVRTGNPHPAGHTRLPRYARDKPGRVHLHHGAHVLPDTNAHQRGEAPAHLYTVAISARDLWGPEAAAKDKVFLDIWECHLEAI